MKSEPRNIAASRDAEAEVGRLEAGFNAFRPMEDMLAITSMAILDAPPLLNQDIKGAFKNARPVVLSAGDSPDTTYFPYHLGRAWVAVVPSDEDKFKSIIVPNGDFGKMHDILHLSPSNHKVAVGLKLVVRPRRIDARQPMLLEGKNMWLMMTDIKILEIWDPKFKYMVWSYNAPGFESEETHDLLDLYNK